MELIETQFKFAIDARDKLNDNYYKWMSYYYVANAAVLVAITTLFNKAPFDKGILGLSLIGLFVCVLWNFSCKGYYYWSKSWIEIIIKLEKGIIGDNKELGVYSIFSKEVALNHDSSWIPNKPANISTPKITLLFSFFAILGWLGFSIFEFLNLFSFWPILAKALITIVFILLLIVIYIKLLPKWARSRDNNLHDLI